MSTQSSSVAEFTSYYSMMLLVKGTRTNTSRLRKTTDELKNDVTKARLIIFSMNRLLSTKRIKDY